jgi:hypothetical protein
MKNLVCHVTNSRSNHGTRRKGVHHHMFVTIGIDTNETCQLDYKYSIFCKNFSSMLIVKNGTKMEENDIVKKKHLKSIEIVSQY